MEALYWHYLYSFCYNTAMFNFCPNCGAQVKNSAKSGFQCTSCHKTCYYNSKPTVGIIPFCKDKILVSVRGIEPDKGFLDTVGGFLTYGEEPLDGAVREFKEETGLVIEKLKLKFLDIVMGNYMFEGTFHSTLNIVYLISFSEETVLPPQDDVAELVWMSIQDSFPENKMNEYMKKVVELLRSSRLV